MTTLLSWAWVAFVIEADNLFESSGTARLRRIFRVSLAMWANGLRLVDPAGVTVGELRARARARCNLPGLERWGWVTVGEQRELRRPGYGTSRGITPDTVVRPTRAGGFARRVWPETIATVEERWRTRFGAGTVKRVSEALGDRGLSMPWAPPEVHPSDGFFTHVELGEGADNALRPFVFLLGQALAELTLDHESDAGVSLPLAANALRVVGREGARPRDVPKLTGISKEATAMAVGFAQRARLATMSAERVLRLTPKGLSALERYEERSRRTTKEPLRRALVAILGQGDALAEGFVAPEGCWRRKKPWVAHTLRLLADPTGSLPWQPMVLHRGGWPDGS